MTIHGGAGGEQSPYRPQAVEKFPPCIKACPTSFLAGFQGIRMKELQIGPAEFAVIRERDCLPVIQDLKT